MSEYIGQQSNWNPGADEEARRRIREQERIDQEKQNPQEDEEARRRIEEQRRQEEERNKERPMDA